MRIGAPTRKISFDTTGVQPDKGEEMRGCAEKWVKKRDL
jgi:hypothetical protein